VHRAEVGVAMALRVVETAEDKSGNADDDQ
jgi:hypothetical protein